MTPKPSSTQPLREPDLLAQAASTQRIGAQFASNLALALRRKGWNSERLGEAARLGARHIDSYLQSKTAPGSIELHRICHALGTTPALLGVDPLFARRVDEIDPADPRTVEGLDRRRDNLGRIMVAQAITRERLAKELTAVTGARRDWPSIIQRVLRGQAVDRANYEHISTALRIPARALDEPALSGPTASQAPPVHAAAPLGISPSSPSAGAPTAAAAPPPAEAPSPTSDQFFRADRVSLEPLPTDRSQCRIIIEAVGPASAGSAMLARLVQAASGFGADRP